MENPIIFDIVMIEAQFIDITVRAFESVCNELNTFVCNLIPSEVELLHIISIKKITSQNLYSLITNFTACQVKTFKSSSNQVL
jgi:hypothetical protein